MSGGQEPDTAAPSAMRWLEPGEIQARWDQAGARLTIRLSGSSEDVDARAAMAFPVSAAGRFIDLCNGKGESIGMLRSLDGLDAESRKAVEAALATRYLIPKIARILELTETTAFVLCWRVETDRGERIFHSESPREAVRYQGRGRIRITDLTGNHYDIQDTAALDPRSRALLELFL